MNAPADKDDLLRFCRQVRERSREHQEAMRAAAQHRWMSVAVGILRQELDSMVRVIFLLAHQDPAGRASLLAAAIAGEEWKIPTAKGKLKRVTDRDMVELAQTLHGWTRSVYRFGCGFIHLSRLHDYHANDPFRALPRTEREWIAQHLRYYHGGTASPDSTFEEIAAYAPRVLGKIASNLECYVSRLESGDDLGEG